MNRRAMNRRAMNRRAMNRRPMNRRALPRTGVVGSAAVCRFTPAPARLSGAVGRSARPGRLGDLPRPALAVCIGIALGALPRSRSPCRS